MPFLMLVLIILSITYHYIARYDEIDVLQQMTLTGFDVNSQDQFGTTALHNASANGNMFEFSLLINT